MSDSTIISLGWRDVTAAGICMADGPEGSACPSWRVFEARLSRQGMTVRLCERHLHELAALAKRTAR